MDEASKILSDLTIHMKYARYLSEEQRRESWEEIITRNKEMHLNSFSHLGEQFTQEIEDLYTSFVYTKKILPSMRSLQFSGLPIELSPNRIYNCAFMPIDSMSCFYEGMFLLLGGTGIGYSVQRHHIRNLPEVRKPNKDKYRRYLIEDSIEGWADSVKILIECYTGDRKSSPKFDYKRIRPKGSSIKTSGGKAPGPQPLRECLVKIEGLFQNKTSGSQLTPLEAHDILCHIADAVLSGGIRRAAMICLFSANDYDMIASKSGNWWEHSPHRGRANNSAVIIRHRVDRKFFRELWQRIRASGSGEPGIYFSNDKSWGTNPCCEIALRPYQFCNLTELNASTIRGQKDLEERAVAAAFLGTLQAYYTDFHYLRDVWKTTTERDALLGVSMTGIASNRCVNLDLEHATYLTVEENKRVSHLLGINSAARVTCIKPAGTTSLVLGSSSGIHAWFAPYYIRRIRVNKTEDIYGYMLINNPDLVEDDYFDPNSLAIISIPQKAPKKAIVSRTETALSFLERVKRWSIRWVKPGHINGSNSHNVSATVYIQEDEWDSVGEWMWMNRHYYNGLSVLPHDGGTYVQAPFEEIDKETYESMLALVRKIDLTKVIEVDDYTDLQGEIACVGGLCEI